MSRSLVAAREYARHGWHVFPLHGVVDGACTCARSDCSSPGKHPLVRHGLHEATTDRSQIEKWWARWPAANIGVATGERSGIVVIDIDLGHRTNTAFGSRSEEAQGRKQDVWGSLDRVIHRLPTTLTGLTGGGGLHLLYRARFQERVRNRTSSLPGMRDLPGIDVRGDGGYVVAPPSIHVSGIRYSWLDDDQTIAEPPLWLRDKERPSVAAFAPSKPRFSAGDGTRYGLAALREELEVLRAAQVGTRNHQLNASAFSLAQLVAGGEVLESFTRRPLVEVGLMIGLGEGEVRRTIDSAFEAGMRLPRNAAR